VTPVSVTFLNEAVKQLERLYGKRVVAPLEAMQEVADSLGRAEAAFQRLLPAASEQTREPKAAQV
jgi:hypothetical protein